MPSSSPCLQYTCGPFRLHVPLLRAGSSPGQPMVHSSNQHVFNKRKQLLFGALLGASDWAILVLHTAHHTVLHANTAQSTFQNFLNLFPYGHIFLAKRLSCHSAWLTDIRQIKPLLLSHFPVPPSSDGCITTSYMPRQIAEGEKAGMFLGRVGDIQLPTWPLPSIPRSGFRSLLLLLVDLCLLWHHSSLWSPNVPRWIWDFVYFFSILVVSLH